MKTKGALTAKEIRLLLPAYGAALLLSIMPVWLLPDHFYIYNYYTSTATGTALCPFCLGLAMLALSSFGREFGMKTFPLLLAQPVSRHRLWRTKIEILGPAVASLFLAWVFSVVLRIGSVSSLAASYAASRPGWVLDQSMSARPVLLGLMQSSAVMTLAIFAGGLCWTLLLRQVAAAFWFTVFIPVALLTVVTMLNAPVGWVYVALGVYSVAAFVWARWLFYQAQEVGWTGGTIAFPGSRSADATRPAIRSRRPLAALFWKEVQLHQVGLAGMVGLFLLHLAVVALRVYGRHSFSDSLQTGLDVFGGIWFLVPLMIGGASVAEERKLGTMQAHLTLPVSRRVQFSVKLLMVLLIGGLLSALLAWTAEGIASSMGASCGVELLKTPFTAHALAMLCLLFLAWSLICFYASTLVGGLIQSFAASVVTAGALWLVVALVGWLYSVLSQKFGFGLWRYDNDGLLLVIGLPSLVVTIVYLGYRNFKNVSDGWRLWYHNLLAFLAVVIGAVLTMSAIYNRAWEFLTPLEPAHGPARITGTRLPSLGSHLASGGSPKVFLPDGRIWTDQLAFDDGKPRLGFRVGQKWIVPPGNHFLPGSNWADAALKNNETVAIRTDGTLWVSERPRKPVPRKDGLPVWDDQEPPPPLVQFGTETNWQTVVSANWQSQVAVLLKQDGTLWLWGPTLERIKEDDAKHRRWSGFPAFAPRRLGTESNWARIMGQRSRVYAWNNRGEAWSIYQVQKDPPPPAVKLEPETWMVRIPEIDHLKLAQIAVLFPYIVGLGEDGSLCGWVHPEFVKNLRLPLQRLVRFGNDHDWTSLASDNDNLVTRRADGSLWQWNFGGYNRWDARKLEALSPTRLGTHNDWLAVGDAFFIVDDVPADGSEAGWVGVVSLAADGSLWHWWDRASYYNYYDSKLFGYFLSPSRKPSYIANIFDN